MEAPTSTTTTSDTSTSSTNAAALREKLGILTDDDLCVLLGDGKPISDKTLQNRRLQGNLPPSTKTGRGHVTTVADFQKWLCRGWPALKTKLCALGVISSLVGMLRDNELDVSIDRQRRYTLRQSAAARARWSVDRIGGAA